MDIDFVITYVDGNDLRWQEEKSRYLPNDSNKETDNSNIRYRDWGTLKYLFRGIEKFAPWVHKVFLVTCGHYPNWINKGYEKLRIIRHDEYIPSKWLPTFSSHTIELNFNRIMELSEHFVYFNDDMFLLGKTTPDFFFHKGLPRDSAILRMWPSIDLSNSHPFTIPLFDVDVINRNFEKQKSLFGNLYKWFAPCYHKELLSNFYLLPTKRFTGFYEKHLMNSFLKSTFDEVWEKEKDVLEATCMNKFRSYNDVNQYIFRYWQLASGNFYPRSPNFGRSRKINCKNIDDIRSFFCDNRIKAICLNDDDITDDEFIELKKSIIGLFEEILPCKSKFEN